MSFVNVSKKNKNGTRRDGMEEMREQFDKMEKRLFYIRPNDYVGSFGIRTGDGFNHIINWRVSGTRRDSRHGYVGEPAFHNRHTNELIESMFKGWK